MTKAGQRRIKQLDTQYDRGIARLDKWSKKVFALQRTIAAQEKDLDNIEKELNELTLLEQ